MENENIDSPDMSIRFWRCEKCHEQCCVKSADKPKNKKCVSDEDIDKKVVSKWRPWYTQRQWTERDRNPKKYQTLDDADLLAIGGKPYKSGANKMEVTIKEEEMIVSEDTCDGKTIKWRVKKVANDNYDCIGHIGGDICEDVAIFWSSKGMPEYDEIIYCQEDAEFQGEDAVWWIVDQHKQWIENKEK